jgi:hypothetical protein
MESLAATQWLGTALILILIIKRLCNSFRVKQLANGDQDSNADLLTINRALLMKSLQVLHKVKAQPHLRSSVK